MDNGCVKLHDMWNGLKHVHVGPRAKNWSVLKFDTQLHTLIVISDLNNFNLKPKYSFGK